MLNPNTKDPKNGQNLFDFGRDSKTYWVKGLTPFHWRVQTGYTFRRFWILPDRVPVMIMITTRSLLLCDLLNFI